LKCCRNNTREWTFQSVRECECRIALFTRSTMKFTVSLNNTQTQNQYIHKHWNFSCVKRKYFNSLFLSQRCIWCREREEERKRERYRRVPGFRVATIATTSSRSLMSIPIMTRVVTVLETLSTNYTSIINLFDTIQTVNQKRYENNNGISSNELDLFSILRMFDSDM
jgi:hypothetical protein